MGKDIFWEDAAQAGERLPGCYILHGDEPVLVAEVRPPTRGSADTIPKVIVRDKEDNSKTLLLNDPLFHRFRNLPPIGWVNLEHYKSGVFLTRRPIRARQHGLNSSNVTVEMIRKGETEVKKSDIRYDTVARDAGYVQACKGDYPGMDEVLLHIREDTCIAVSPLYAIHRDGGGLRWLYRNIERVGLFPETNSLLLMGKNVYLREELMEDSRITLTDIKEF